MAAKEIINNIIELVLDEFDPVGTYKKPGDTIEEQ
jgi:hypothetical protein